MTNDIYSTRDFYLTAYFIAAGVSIHSYRRQNGITVFDFIRTDELRELEREYYADSATISPIRNGNSVKNLKCLLHSNTNNHKILHLLNTKAEPQTL